MILDPVEILKQLVAIPSVNPMDREPTGPIFGEARLTDFLEETFSRIGLTTFRQPVSPGRENFIARLDGDAGSAREGRLLLFDAHQDTVPVEGMTVEPFQPLQREGRLHGRGACDVKGGMAAIIAAAARLADRRPSPRPTIVVACTVNEEHGFSGASRLTKLWDEDGGEIVPRRPDAAIVAEPTDLDAIVAHKGVIRWRCHALGCAGHSSRPVAADNAIYRMARVVAAIERYAAELETAGPAHPLCGRRTLSVGTIRGGSSVGTVPDRCTIEIDCRPPPGESPEEARQQLIDHLSQPAITSFPLEHDLPFMSGPPLSDRDNERLADRLLRSAGEVVGRCRWLGVPYATNAAFFAAAGVPSVVFGPGSIEQAHTADEWISLDQLRQATEIIHRFCLSFS